MPATSGEGTQNALKYWEREISFQEIILQRPADNGTFSETLKHKEENTMEMNRTWAAGADENTKSQGDPKEDRQSNLSRNSQTLKEQKLTQGPVAVILVLKEKLMVCNTDVLGTHIIHKLISYIFRKQLLQDK